MLTGRATRQVVVSGVAPQHLRALLIPGSLVMPPQPEKQSDSSSSDHPNARWPCDCLVIMSSNSSLSYTGGQGCGGGAGFIGTVSDVPTRVHDAFSKSVSVNNVFQARTSITRTFARFRTNFTQNTCLLWPFECEAVLRSRRRVEKLLYTCIGSDAPTMKIEQDPRGACQELLHRLVNAP